MSSRGSSAMGGSPLHSRAGRVVGSPGNFPTVHRRSSTEDFQLAGTSAPRLRESERLPAIEQRQRAVGVSVASPSRVRASNMGELCHFCACLLCFPPPPQKVITPASVGACVQVSESTAFVCCTGPPRRRTHRGPRKSTFGTSKRM